MKKLIDYKEEIHKCSKCGLCQSVCPVYKITGNDCSVSRGKFIMLNGIIKGDLKLNKNVNKYLDMCLKCNACKDFCPSDIDARQIFLTAKSEYFKQAPEKKIISLFQSKFVFKFVLNIVKIAINTYRFLKFDKLARKFYPILTKRMRKNPKNDSFLRFFKSDLGSARTHTSCGIAGDMGASRTREIARKIPNFSASSKMGNLGKKIILTNEFVSTNVVGQECPTYEYDQNSSSSSGIPARQRKTMKVVYFKGCVNEFINPKAKNAAENVLTRMGVEILPVNFECCGVPFLSCGNVEQFKKQAVFNLSQIPDDFDFFLTDCASCQNAFEEYKYYIEDKTLLKKLKKIQEKSININEFVVKNAKSIEFAQKVSFTFHKPCHLENTDFIKEFLGKSKNIEYVEMKDFDKCCGFSGEFAIKNPALSEQISSDKAQNASDTNADYILTSCPACVLGLTQGLIANSMNLTDYLPLNFIEFIALAEKIC